MNIVKDFDNNYLITGIMYRGEVLIVDFGVDKGVDEDKWYVVLNNGDIVEVVNKE